MSTFVLTHGGGGTSSVSCRTDSQPLWGRGSEVNEPLPPGPTRSHTPERNRHGTLRLLAALGKSQKREMSRDPNCVNVLFEASDEAFLLRPEQPRGFPPRRGQRVDPVGRPSGRSDSGGLWGGELPATSVRGCHSWGTPRPDSHRDGWKEAVTARPVWLSG